MAGLIEWDDDFFLISRMFEVCTSNDAGIFIFAGENKSFLSSSWTAYFIGEIADFQTLPYHSQWAAAQAKGATHVHTLVMGENKRKNLVEKLIKKYKPAINLKPVTQQVIQSISTETIMPNDTEMTGQLSETKSKLELLYQYEKHYLGLIKEYKEEIKFANTLQEDLRRERSQFFTQTLKDVIQTMKTAEVDKTVSAQWIQELVANYTKSIDLSSDLAKTHVIEIINTLSTEAKQEVAHAKLNNIGTQADVK
jgi:hypothetical protein